MEIAFIVALKQTIRLPHSIQIRYDITLSSYRVFEWRMVRHRAKDVAISRYEKLFRPIKRRMVKNLCFQNKNLTFAEINELR